MRKIIPVSLIHIVSSVVNPCPWWLVRNEYKVLVLVLPFSTNIFYSYRKSILFLQILCFLDCDFIIWKLKHSYNSPDFSWSEMALDRACQKFNLLRPLFARVLVMFFPVLVLEIKVLVLDTWVRVLVLNYQVLVLVLVGQAQEFLMNMSSLFVQFCHRWYSQLSHIRYAKT